MQWSFKLCGELESKINVTRRADDVCDRSKIRRLPDLLATGQLFVHWLLYETIYIIFVRDCTWMFKFVPDSP
jgi:hypothetical protein